MEKNVSESMLFWWRLARPQAVTGMAQMNKDERVWVCFEMARVHAVQRLWPNRWPAREFLPSL